MFSFSRLFFHHRKLIRLPPGMSSSYAEAQLDVFSAFVKTRENIKIKRKKSEMI
jgi:hypothetical protein